MLRERTWDLGRSPRLSSSLVLCVCTMLLVACGGNSGAGSGGAGGNGGGGGTGGGTGGGGAGGNAITISRVEPSRVMVGVLQGAVDLEGTNFSASDTVLFDGAAVNTRYQNPSLEFDIPSSTWNVAKVHSVQVSNGAGTKSNTAAYEVYSPQPGPDVFVAQPTQYLSEGVMGLVPDLNGDGRADLIVSTLDPTTSQYLPEVRFGQADGSFGPAVSLGSINFVGSASAVLAGDVNGDGTVDLILLSQSINAPGSYQVLVNDGTARFTSVATGALPVTGIPGIPALAGDFNGDGKLDFAYAATANGQAFSMYFGSGNGTFSSPSTFGTASGGLAYSPVVADLNGDGCADLVYVYSVYQMPSQIRALLSGPRGSFTDTALAGLPSPNYGFVVGDFNHDHIPDVFAVDSNGIGSAYLGVGDGTFTPSGFSIQTYDGFLANPPYVVGDFDNDGNMDVATRAQFAGPDQILFLFGDGTGKFTPQRVISDHSFWLQVGDINGDGLPDILSESDPGFGYQSVVLGRNDRNFPSPPFVTPRFQGLLSAADVFADGYTDLLVGGTGTGGLNGLPGVIYHFQPNGTFVHQGQAPTYSTVLVDLDGDGIADMVGFSGTDMLFWKGDGTGIFRTPTAQITPPNGFLPYYFRDMDGDGFMDIVLPGVILYGKPNLQFDTVPITFYENFAVGDFDGDGIPDILTGSGVMFGQGNRTFTAPTGVSPLSNYTSPFPTDVVADINGDGKDDIVLGTVIFLSAGRQGFYHDQTLMINGYAASIGSVTVADFNGDGLKDIAVGMLTAGEDVLLFTNDGTGKYQLTSYAIGVGSAQSIAADFNRDGKPDLAILDYFSYAGPTVTILLHK